MSDSGRFLSNFIGPGIRIWKSISIPACAAAPIDGRCDDIPMGQLGNVRECDTEDPVIEATMLCERSC